MTTVWHSDAANRAAQYALRHRRLIRDQLGAGYDGIVFSTDLPSAIKSLRYEELYRRERDVYFRLYEHGVESVSGFAVPRLVFHDDELWVLEMEIVSPPFVLDFAGAYLDSRPDYPRAVVRRWEAEKRSQFGSRWPRVKQLMAAFERYGIYLADVKPGNVTFGDEPI